MRKLLLKNVGDGLNLIINNQRHHDLTVDFGGDENIHCYCYFHDSFLLSHFHADHYNGILNCRHYHGHWDLENFYHPGMPTFTEAKQFFISLLTINGFLLNLMSAIAAYAFFPKKPSIKKDIEETKPKLIEQFQKQMQLMPAA